LRALRAISGVRAGDLHDAANVSSRGFQKIFHIHNCHLPPPGRRIAPPDDWLQRMIQQSPVSAIDRVTAAYWMPRIRGA
jgi:hypothetical protein